MRRALPLVLLLLPAIASAQRGQTLEQLFEAGNQAAFAGDHEAAIRHYQRLVEAGVEDADLSFNLGTVYAQSGQYGRAIQHFERALRFDPGDDDAQKSLEDARDVLITRRAEAEGEAVLDEGRGFGEDLVRPFHEPLLAILLLVLELLFFGFWLLRRRAARGKLGLTIGAVVVGTLFLAVGLGLLTKRGFFRDGEPAVVVRDRAELREGPDPRAARRGVAREGESAAILDADGDFLRVELGSGARGWLAKSDVGRI